jgi:hypothetical protein
VEIILNEVLKIDGENRKTIFHDITLDFPEGYTCMGHRDNTVNVAFGVYPNTIGVLWFTPIILEETDQAIKVFNEWVEEYPNAVEMNILGYKGWFVTEDAERNELDKFFWPGYEGEMVIYNYLFRIANGNFMFNYRIPSIYEDNGMFDKEHEAKMSIIQSSMMYV